jgi:hypothetical protein
VFFGADNGKPYFFRHVRIGNCGCGRDGAHCHQDDDA